MPLALTTFSLCATHSLLPLFTCLHFVVFLSLIDLPSPHSLSLCPSCIPSAPSPAASFRFLLLFPWVPEAHASCEPEGHLPPEKWASAARAQPRRWPSRSQSAARRVSRRPSAPPPPPPPPPPCVCARRCTAVAVPQL